MPTRLRAAAERITGEQPNIDFALGALTAAYDLPADTPLTLFAMARSVGWVAHALEQRAIGSLIRPRARYVGPPLEMLELPLP
jgi:citrate synthase